MSNRKTKSRNRRINKKARKSKVRQRKRSTRDAFTLTDTRIPHLAPWIAAGMPDDGRAPARWRTSPATDERSQVCVLHLNELYQHVTTPRDEDELMFALAKIDHEHGRHVTFHYSAACSRFAVVMFSAQRPAFIAETLGRHWDRVLQERHGLGDPFSGELRWSLPSAPAEMEVLLGLTFLNQQPNTGVAA